jgi:hypothetical protein
VFGQYRETAMARTERYKLALRSDGKGPGELYDLPVDAVEHVNQFENPEYVGVKNSLSAEIAQWKKQYSA